MNRGAGYARAIEDVTTMLLHELALRRSDSEPHEALTSTLDKVRALRQRATYEELTAQVRRLQDEGKLPKHLTAEEKIDWAYGKHGDRKSGCDTEDG